MFTYTLSVISVTKEISTSEQYVIYAYLFTCISHAELTNCSIALDCCIAADSSNSINDDDFIILVDIISQIVDGLNVGPTAQDSRVAMVKYGRDVFREFNLTAYTDKTTLVTVAPYYSMRSL